MVRCLATHHLENGSHGLQLLLSLLITEYASPLHTYQARCHPALLCGILISHAASFTSVQEVSVAHIETLNVRRISAQW
jgi:hypothetical protein